MAYDMYDALAVTAAHVASIIGELVDDARRATDADGEYTVRAAPARDERRALVVDAPYRTAPSSERSRTVAVAHALYDAFVGDDAWVRDALGVHVRVRARRSLRVWSVRGGGARATLRLHVERAAGGGKSSAPRV